MCGKTKVLPGALVGVREVAQRLADQLAVHLARVVAHLLVAHGDAGVAQAEPQLLDRRSSTAWPPEAQAFSTASMGLPSMPGIIAISPASSPCSFSEKLHAEPMVPTSSAPASMPIWSHRLQRPQSTICGTVWCRAACRTPIDDRRRCRPSYLPMSILSNLGLPVTTPPSHADHRAAGRTRPRRRPARR